MTELEEALADYLAPGQLAMATRRASDRIVHIIASARGEGLKEARTKIRKRLGKVRANLFLEPSRPDDYEDD